MSAEGQDRVWSADELSPDERERVAWIRRTVDDLGPLSQEQEDVLVMLFRGRV